MITWPGYPFIFFKLRPLDAKRSGLEFMTHRPSSRFQSLRILSWWIVQSQRRDAFKRLGAGQRTKQWLIRGPDFKSEIEGTSISLGWNLTRNLSFDFWSAFNSCLIDLYTSCEQSAIDPVYSSASNSKFSYVSSKLIFSVISSTSFFKTFILDQCMIFEDVIDGLN